MINRVFARKTKGQKGAFGRCKRFISSPPKDPIVKLECADCAILLVKFDIPTGKVLYKIEGLYEEGKDGHAVRILCPKCYTWNEITKQGCVNAGKDE